MNLGVFGGTFNPPHTGHLIVVESVCDQLQFDKVLFIPSANPPHKNDPLLAPAMKRLEMTKLAVQGNNLFEVSDIEILRGGTSYSVDTLSALRKLYANATLSLIIGSDNFLEFEKWKSAKEIFDRANVVVMSRPGFSVQSLQRDEMSRMARFVNVPHIGVSATDIRRRIKLGRSIRYLVPQAVEDYILRSGLYKD